ncbi:MAG: hypothetical protein AMXMBFR45_13200 [Gammaproteobacteria bacterium]|nr:hypothetical protein [Gammaproteobacteria bacterium PRO2]
MRSTALITGRRLLGPLLCLAGGCSTPALAAGDLGGLAIEDDYFQAGGSVRLEQTVGGDALLAGATVESNASISGDASLAGGQVAVRATVGQDLYAVAGQVEVDALVQGNARLAGGRVRITPESSIAGGVAIAGGSVDAEGEFGHYLTVAGGDVTIGGIVYGDVRVYAERLTVLPGTRIGGALRYRTTSPVQLPEDLEVGEGISRDEDRTAAAADDWGGASAARGAGWFWFAGLLALGLLLAYAFAGFSRRTTAALGARPWFGMVVGLAVLAGVPFLAVALAITLVGLPLALILVLVYLAMLIGAYVVGALYLGDRALEVLRPGQPASAGRRLLALLLVLLLLALVGGLPLLGSLARLAVLLLGMGGIVLALWGWPRAPVAGSHSAGNVNPFL